jgi:pyruvate/2-oxoglutarate dehydrogenase complex dihydrolipoamide acyltransferase (E2) component
LWQEDEPGVISVWFYEDGATVAEDDILAEIMVQKSNFEMFSPGAGTLRILVNEEQEVAKGTKIAEIV